MADPSPSTDQPEKKDWLDDRRNVNKLIGILVAVCVALVIVDAFHHKHVHLAFEESFPVFYGVYGFLAYCVIVLSAKALRRLLKRDEDYYDR
ncbi:MAG: hypothetical protein WAV07_01060 [Candidatus Contendobacter sp.]